MQPSRLICGSGTGAPALRPTRALGVSRRHCSHPASGRAHGGNASRHVQGKHHKEAHSGHGGPNASVSLGAAGAKPALGMRRSTVCAWCTRSVVWQQGHSESTASHTRTLPHRPGGSPTAIAMSLAFASRAPSETRVSCRAQTSVGLWAGACARSAASRGNLCGAPQPAGQRTARTAKDRLSTRRSPVHTVLLR